MTQLSRSSQPPASARPHTPALLGSEYIRRALPHGNWIVNPFLPVGGTLLIQGPPKLGKSFAATQLAAAIAFPAPDWLGFPIELHGPVLYLQADTPPAAWQARCELLLDAGCKGIEAISFADRLVLPQFPFDIKDSASFSWLAKEASRLPYVAVVIDTLREVHRLDEDKSRDMQEVVAELSRAVSGVGLVLVHHTRKPSGDRPHSVINDSRGSSYLPGHADCIIGLSPSRWTCAGRTIEETTIPMMRLPSGLWCRPNTPEQREALAQANCLRELLENIGFESDYARAKEFIKAYPAVSLKAAQKRIERARKS